MSHPSSSTQVFAKLGGLDCLSCSRQVVLSLGSAFPGIQLADAGDAAGVSSCCAAARMHMRMHWASQITPRRLAFSAINISIRVYYKGVV